MGSGMCIATSVLNRRESIAAEVLGATRLSFRLVFLVLERKMVMFEVILVSMVGLGCIVSYFPIFFDFITDKFFDISIMVLVELFF